MGPLSVILKRAADERLELLDDGERRAARDKVVGEDGHDEGHVAVGVLGEDAGIGC